MGYDERKERVKRMNTLDLHMHSDISIDGSYTPRELAAMCCEAGLTHMAIADHNSVKGVLQLEKEGDLGIRLIPAIEIDCVFQEKEFHLLGYGIDPHDPVYEKLEADFMSQEVHHANARIDYTKNTLGLQFDEEVIKTLMRHGVITPEAIMEACLQDDRNLENPYMQVYLPGGKRSDNPMVNYYWDHFSQGNPGYMPSYFPSLKDMTHMIHKQGGIAVLAHPGNNIHEDAELLKGVIACGIDGMEVYSSYHSDEQIAYYRFAAKEYRLLKTCGSDFHGKTKPSIHLGQCDCSEDEKQQLMHVMDRLCK